MNREIKFRVWTHFDDSGWGMLDMDCIKDWPVELLNCDDEDVVMQFTDLKDKDDTDIYEGDILRHDLWGVDEVIWDKESACFRGKNIEHDITLAHHQLLRSKVVGNIYENPELLIK